MSHNNIYPTLPEFVWQPKTMTSQRCEWLGYTIEAWSDGRWVVYSPSRDQMRGSDEQVKGRTIQEAKQRAQAATLILHDLLSRETT